MAVPEEAVFSVQTLIPLERVDVTISKIIIILLVKKKQDIKQEYGGKVQLTERTVVLKWLRDFATRKVTKVSHDGLLGELEITLGLLNSKETRVKKLR